MASKKKKQKKRKITLSYYILLFILLFILSAVLSFKVFSYEGLGLRKNLKNTKVLHSNEKREFVEDLKLEESKQIVSQRKQDDIPRVAIVIDDLGPNKRPVIRLLNINASLTLSILPHETYSLWIAEQGHQRGLDVIAHIPMEAEQPNSLGKGGLYKRMKDDEIRKQLLEDIAIPHIKGVSNHMGSAFTADKRAMKALISVLKEQGLFFLDSFTTPRSVGKEISRLKGVKAFKRDVFLDNTDNSDDIEANWKKLIALAKKKGYAVGLAHPKKNTINFLEKALPSSEVHVVPLSKLVAY